VYEAQAAAGFRLGRVAAQGVPSVPGIGDHPPLACLLPSTLSINVLVRDLNMRAFLALLMFAASSVLAAAPVEPARSKAAAADP